MRRPHFRAKRQSVVMPADRLFRDENCSVDTALVRPNAQRGVVCRGLTEASFVPGIAAKVRVPARERVCSVSTAWKGRATGRSGVATSASSEWFMFAGVALSGKNAAVSLAEGFAIAMFSTGEDIVVVFV